MTEPTNSETKRQDQQPGYVGDPISPDPLVVAPPPQVIRPGEPFRVIRSEELNLDRMDGMVKLAAASPTPFTPRMRDPELLAMLDKAAAAIGWMVCVWRIEPPAVDPKPGTAEHNRLECWLKKTHNFPTDDYSSSIAQLVGILQAELKKAHDKLNMAAQPSGIEEQE